MYHIITVVGARPQFVKAAALSKAFAKSKILKETIVHSGQHYDQNLSGGFFDELNIPKPKYNLAIGSRSHNQMIGTFLLEFDKILDIENPDMILVYGDTNTTAAGAIAAAKRNIPLAHVEAGLREFDKSIPEEVNKLLTDSVADLLFSPTETGVNNLKNTGIVKNVYNTGDISLDLLFQDTKFLSLEELKVKFNVPDQYIFMTCHRDANTRSKEPLSQIIKGISDCNLPVFFSIHPRTQKALVAYDLLDQIGENVVLIEPLGFWDTQSMIKHAYCTVTDSGGIIKETYFHKVPGIIIDKQTEWVETIREGWNQIIGPNADKITSAIASITPPSTHTNALGDGQCGTRIVDIIENYLQNLR